MVPDMMAKCKADLPQLPRRKPKLSEHILPVAGDGIDILIEDASCVTKDHNVVQYAGHVGLCLPR